MTTLQELKETVARLRAPGGCPWDREQTYQSLCALLVEEYSELLEAIDNLDIPHIQEELGDILLHVFLYAQIAEEKGDFSLEAVAQGVNEKLIRRHPHVFGDVKLQTSEEVLAQWDIIKEKEASPKKEKKLFKDQPPQLPALLFASKTYKKAHKLNLPIEKQVDATRVATATENLTEEKAGQMLFELAAACQKVNIDPESALRRFTTHFISSFES